jgi:hypothetical protein
MGVVALPYTISNPIVLTAAMLNGNFLAISTQVNGNLEGVNLSDLAQLTGATVTAAEIKTPKLNPSDTLVIKLADAAGVYSLKIKDYLGQIRVEIKSSGEVTIY